MKSIGIGRRRGGGKGGATLIYEMRKDRREVEQRGKEAKGEDATMKNQSWKKIGIFGPKPCLLRKKQK